MKKYAIILLLLILIGAALTVRWLTQDQRLDQTVFLQTTESIRNLQALDKTLGLLLNKSRYNSDFDHDQLSDTNYEISEEFDNLRFEALFEEIEGSPALSDAIAEFEAQFILREEKLDAYIDGNSATSESLQTINQMSSSLLSSDLGGQKNQIYAFLGRTNADIYRLAASGALRNQNDNRVALQTQIEGLLESSSEEITTALSSYVSAAETIFANDQPTKTLFMELESLQTGPLLDSIEDEYTAYHNQAISGSNQFRNALVIYGLCLFGALLFFGFQIRRSYLSLEQQVADRTAEIKTAYHDLQESQEQLVQSEKMASLGQMVAGVAHEINTPLGYVTSNVDTLKLNLDDLNPVIKGLESVLDVIQSSGRDNQEITRRVVACLKVFKQVDAGDLMSESTQLLNDGAFGLSEISKLVTSLKDFARLDRQSTEQIDVHDCIDNSITIASNHIRENDVNVSTHFGELPKIACFPSKLNQLFLNIITNACQAMTDKGGELIITTSSHDEKVMISFQDDGIGMDDETQQKMFDPFYTSKEIGVGTGLGMSIAYKIVDAHSGSINVQSSLGQGTTVIIELPV